MRAPGILPPWRERRFQRAAAILGRIGFRVAHAPAVFVPSTPACQGTNGHRLAMRNAWRIVAKENASMAIFEDDVRHTAYCNRCPMRVTPRIPITEPCLQLIAPACCTQIMLPTQADAPRLTAELRAYLGKHATADVAYLGFLQGHHGKFANHAMWTTPRAS